MTNSYYEFTIAAQLYTSSNATRSMVLIATSFLRLNQAIASLPATTTFQIISFALTFQIQASTLFPSTRSHASPLPVQSTNFYTLGFTQGPTSTIISFSVDPQTFCLLITANTSHVGFSAQVSIDFKVITLY